MSHSLQNKQDKLTAGEGIDITENNISCTMSLAVTPYAIGAYSLGGYIEPKLSSTKTISAGTVKSGSTLYFGTVNRTGISTLTALSDCVSLQVVFQNTAGESKSGTWKLMHNIRIVGSDERNFGAVGLWQRIS